MYPQKSRTFYSRSFDSFITRCKNHCSAQQFRYSIMNWLLVHELHMGKWFYCEGTGSHTVTPKPRFLRLRSALAGEMCFAAIWAHPPTDQAHPKY